MDAKQIQKDDRVVMLTKDVDRLTHAVCRLEDFVLRLKSGGQSVPTVETVMPSFEILYTTILPDTLHDLAGRIRKIQEELETLIFG